VPVFWGERRYVSHFEPVGDGGAYRGPSTAWFRYHLMEDETARSTFYGRFCGLCTSYLWTEEAQGYRVRRLTKPRTRLGAGLRSFGDSY